MWPTELFVASFAAVWHLPWLHAGLCTQPLALAPPGAGWVSQSLLSLLGSWLLVWGGRLLRSLAHCLGCCNSCSSLLPQGASGSSILRGPSLSWVCWWQGKNIPTVLLSLCIWFHSFQRNGWTFEFLFIYLFASVRFTLPVYRRHSLPSPKLRYRWNIAFYILFYTHLIYVI